GQQPSTASLDAPGAHLAFIVAVCEALIAACSGGPEDARSPGILLIEDAHWADTASLDLLTYLVRRLRRQRALLLLSWRESEALANASLQRLQIEAAKGADGATLRLPRLDLSTGRELVSGSEFSSLGDSACAATLSARLYRETEGVPFLLAEYLTALRAGVLAADSNEWSLPGGARDLLRA